MFADLALKGLPKHADQVVRLLTLHLCVKPHLQAFEVDETYTTRTLARHDTWVLFCGVCAPAEPAVALLLTVSLVLYESPHWFSLLQLLHVQLLWSLSHLLTLEVLDSEFDSSKLNHIELFNQVVLCRGEEQVLPLSLEETSRNALLATVGPHYLPPSCRNSPHDPEHSLIAIHLYKVKLSVKFLVNF